MADLERNRSEASGMVGKTIVKAEVEAVSDRSISLVLYLDDGSVMHVEPRGSGFRADMSLVNQSPEEVAEAIAEEVATEIEALPETPEPGEEVDDA